jgi:flagellar assembly factor FliW
MNIETKFHGVKEYLEEDIITFHKGIPGFEGLSKFILFSVAENDFFSVLHSIEDEAVGLVVVSPFNVISKYEVNLEESLVSNLNIKEESDVLIVNAVTLSGKVEKITINLKAPIVINIKAKLGEQIILENENYKIKHPLIQE